MDIQLRKETISINETLLRDNTQVLVQSDIIVPDIKSDMAKILQIDSQASVDEIVISDRRADVSGKVSLNILYVPEGDTKPVCPINTQVPFQTQIENGQISIGSKCIISADACHVEFSMLNSRKLSVKIIVELDTKCVRENSAELVCGVDGELPVEQNIQTFDIYNLVYAGHSKFNMRETLDFPAGKPSAVTVLKSDAKISEREARLVTGKVVVKGTLSLCTLYVSTDNTLEFMEHEIPFTEVLDAEGANENCICDMDMGICGTDFSLRADTDGDMRLLDIDIVLDANANISQNTNLNAISDCFCPTQNLVCESKPFAFDTLAGRGKTQEALRASVSLPENAPELVSVYNLIAKPYISDVKTTRGRANVCGVIDCYVLYLSASPTAPVSTQKTQVEFEISVEVDGLDDGMDCDINIEIAHQSYNITMTGEIEIRISLILDAKAIKKNNVPLITDVYVDADSPLEIRHGIIVYFVQPGDTLWKIAKKYRVPLELIAAINRIENPDRLDIGQRLIIPNVIR